MTTSALNGRVALVTGGGTGIGRATASALAEAGAAVAICGRRSEPLEQTAGELRTKGKALAQVADVTDEDERRRLIAAVEDELGQIDILISNAGQHTEIVSWLDWSPEEWRGEVELSGLAAFGLAQLVAPGMCERRFGRIIFVASVLGSLGVDPLIYVRPEAPEGISAVPYHGGKGALIAQARALACVLGPYNVTVNAISPGMIETEGVSFLLPDDVRARLRDRTPARRLGTPEEVAGAIVFLASDEASFITGHDLVIDGGWAAW